MSSSSPIRKKLRLNDTAGFDHLPVTVLDLIFSFMTHEFHYCRDDGYWPLRLKPLFCKDWTKVSRIFNVHTMPEWSVLAFCPDSVPRSVYIRWNGNCDDGFDAAYISRFHKLQSLHIESLNMNGTHPFIFNIFPNLRKLAIKSMPHLEFNLDMLSGMHLLEEIRLCCCEKLEGTLNSLRALKDTLHVIEICDCEHINGNFIDLSDFEKLEVLILGEGTSITGDVKDLRVEHFPMLQNLELPAVTGWKYVDSIRHASELLTSLSNLGRERPELFEDHEWKLIESSPEYYQSIADYPAPLMVEFVSEGRAIGYRWTGGRYPDFLGGYWISHCETNWIGQGHDFEYEPFQSFLPNCSRHLHLGRSGVPLVPFQCFHHPPSEQQYRQAIEVNMHYRTFYEAINKPDFNIEEFLGEDHILLAKIRAFHQEFMGHQDANQEVDAHLGADGLVAEMQEIEDARVAGVRSLEARMDNDNDNAQIDAAAELRNQMIHNQQADEEEEDNMSDLLDFEIDDVHTTSDLDRQINIFGTFILTDRNDDPMLTWRAFWSMELNHDVLMRGIRWNHFNRWPREHIAEDDMYRENESKAIYFPGVNASHDAKCAWAGMVVEECAGNTMRPVFDLSWERDFDIPTLDEAPIVISDILLACAPDELSVCLYVDRDKIDRFFDLATVEDDDATDSAFNKGRFSKNSRQGFEDLMAEIELSKSNPGLEDIKKFLSSPDIRADTPDTIKLTLDDEINTNILEERLEQFKHWLKHQATSGGTLHQEDVIQKLPPRRYDKLAMNLTNMRSLNRLDTNLVLLARRDNVSKRMSSEEVLDDMIASLGLVEDIVNVKQTHSRNPDVHGYSYITSECIGGNIHFPDGEGMASIAFTWSSTSKLTEEHLQKRRYRLAFETKFLRDAQATKAASNGHVSFILWPRASDSLHGSTFESGNGSGFPPDTTSVDSNNAFLIWLPGDYDTIEEELYSEFLGRGGNSRISMITTRHGNVFWDTAIAYLQKVIMNGQDLCLGGFPTISNNDSLEFCHLLAFTRTLIEADELIQDTEYAWDEIKEFFNSLSMQWRSLLLKSDEVLGLGLEGDATGLSREGLYLMLEFYQSKFHFYMSEIRDDYHEEDEAADDEAEDFRFAPFPLLDG